MIKMTIDRIGVSLNSYQRVVILKEKEAERRLIIWIGPAEAESIAIKMQNIRVPRPLTHDLLNLVIPELGGEIRHILISGLKDDTYFAKIIVHHGDKDIEIDQQAERCRRVGRSRSVPIYSTDEVLDEAGVLVQFRYRRLRVRQGHRGRRASRGDGRGAAKAVRVQGLRRGTEHR